MGLEAAAELWVQVEHEFEEQRENVLLPVLQRGNVQLQHG